eukprot:TRINITY_DN2185_c0_g1_i2.p1 TRINITY_DN2185_c0_g1~~TRINITY_DN2185_c0_g1_i2.p1  ORF type:complete len:820 (+),score=149.24 TRINITY_DN2185_c0_g1_i2:255-2714(+)
MVDWRWRERWANCTPPVKWSVFVGLALAILGVVLISSGVGTYYYLDSRIKDEVRSYLVIDGKNNDGYKDWEHNDYPDAVPFYTDYYLWNLTNAAECQANHSIKPNLEAVGPFSYRRYMKKIAVEFLDQGNQVSYSEWLYYIYQPDRSVPLDPYTTNITSFNLAYMNVMNTVGSESGLVYAILGPTLGKIMTLLTTVFVDIVVQQSTALNLPALQNQVIQRIMQARSLNTTEATAAFYDEWCNSTTPDPAIWSPLGVLFSNTYNKTFSSNITVAAAELLWNASVQMLPTLVNANPSSGVLVWYAAVYSANPVESGAARAALVASFGITEQQLDLIVAWQFRLQSSVVRPQVFTQFNVTSAKELGYLQWGTGAVTGGVSVRDLAPSFGLTGIPEIGIWSNKSLTFDVATAQNLLSGPRGLLDTTNMVTFLTLVRMGDNNTIRAMWGLSMPEASALALYVTANIGPNFALPALTTAFNPLATANNLGGGGLVSTRSPHQWIFGMNDTLLELLNLPDTYVSFVTNQTTEQIAYDKRNNSVFYTGKDDLNDIGRYIKWKGLTVLPVNNPWAEKEEVEGYYGDTFAPFMDDGDKLDVWIPELMRNTRLEYTDEVTKYDITLYRYRLSPEDFEENKKFYQGIYGFANLTSPNRMPVFISKARMLDTPEVWRAKLTGVNPDDDDDTYLDVEPITGYVMDVAKKLQVNVFIDNSTTLDMWNANIQKNIIYPIIWTDQNSQINYELASDFKDSVYRVMTIRTWVLWGGVASGVASLVLCLALIVFAVLWYRRMANRTVYLGIPEGLAQPDNTYFPPDTDSTRRSSRTYN